MTATATKGRVNITASRGRLTLRFTVAGSRLAFTDRLKDTPEGWSAARRVASQIELDLISGNLDPTLEKYKANSKVKAILEANKKTPTIQELWSKYLKYRSKVVKESTVYKQFNPITNYLGKLPFKHVEDYIKIQNQIWEDKTPKGAKRLLTQLSACCNWAVKQELIPDNPFQSMASEIKLSKADSSDDMEVNPFTPEERDRIISAFYSSAYYKHYAPLIEFLFLYRMQT